MLDRDQSGNGLEMKNIIVIAFSCLLALLLLHLPYAYSATIYLKNGGSIETDRYWEENNVLKCSKYGGLVEIPIADVLRIIDDKDGQSGELKNRRGNEKGRAKGHRSAPNGFHIEYKTFQSGKKPQVHAFAQCLLLCG